MSLENKYHQIEQYLDGVMTIAEKDAFEKKMQEDQELAAEVRLHKEIEVAVSDPAVDELSAKIKKIQNERTRMPVRKRNILSIRRIMQIAAVLLIAGTFYLFLIFQNNRYSSPAALADAFFEIPETPTLLDKSPSRNGDPETDQESKKAKIKRELATLWTQFEQQYVTSTYSKAIQTLEAMKMIDPEFKIQDSNEWHFNYGLLLLKQQQREEAIDNFDKVQASFTEKANWYKALAYLMTENGVDDSREILDTIVSSSAHPFKKEAKKVLKNLEKIK
ncbi:MAG: hypothetical protein GY705_31760 [Bacteroidetes bacterium]|nr:hypothetical protein [Bacteroidota bacterium]